MNNIHTTQYLLKGDKHACFTRGILLMPSKVPPVIHELTFGTRFH